MINELDKKINEKIIDELYSWYETEISLQNVMYSHPMFYNETFCENNCFRPPIPNELMTRDGFVKKLWSETGEDRWRTSFQVLYNYISKQK